MTNILSFITINCTRLQYYLIDGLNVQEEPLSPFLWSAASTNVPTNEGSDSDDDCVIVDIIRAPPQLRTPVPEVM